MRVPYSWLKEYVDFDENAQQVAALLQQVGVPVENVENNGAAISGVLTCRIESVEQHPDAERLRVCQVNINQATPLQIVTAAPNVRPGQITAVATHGAILADGTKIKKGKLRGVLSEGMFCSAAEVGMDPNALPEDQRVGIFDLDAALPIGKPLQETIALAEDVLIIESFANRCDQLSILGVARELAAKLGRPLHLPEIATEPTVAPNAGQRLVEIQDLTACPRLISRVVEDVHIGPSPDWMVKRLEAAGMRSINNVVDITNYVMLETGQPLHAYDRSCLAEGKIIVRRAQEGETLTTLDGESHVLPAKAIVIADSQKAVGVAGVMGGLHSEITDNTKVLQLEAAAFDCGDVRRASLRLGLRTESSKRFEKGMDLQRVEFGCQRAAYLFGKYCGTLTNVMDTTGIELPSPIELTLRTARVQQVLGITVPSEKIEQLLRALDFKVVEEGENYRITVPSHRQDIVEEIDLVEEIARHYGYDSLPVTVPKAGGNHIHNELDEQEEQVRDCCLRLGLSELLTPSLHSCEFLEKYHITVDAPKIMNPLSEAQRVLRPYIFPFMVETIMRNINVGNTDLRFFELSRVYEKDQDNVQEPRHLALALSYPQVTFFNMKGILERFSEMMRVTLSFERTELPWLHPGRAARVLIGKREIGWLGELHPRLAHELDVEAPIVLAEISIDAVMEETVRSQYQRFSRYQAVERDLAFVVPFDVAAGAMSARMAQVGGALVKSVTCFDCYVGAQVPEGCKSLAFRSILQADDHTLTEDEINKVVKKAVKIVEREFGAKLRD